MKNRSSLGFIGMGLAVAFLVGGCSSNAVVTYQGKRQPLENVAVLTQLSENCHIRSIDGNDYFSERTADSEFHLSPGKHTVDVFYRDASNVNSERWVLRTATLEQEFEAGHVYTITAQSQERQVNPAGDVVEGWKPAVSEEGRVEAFAAANPSYQKGSSDWRQLRKKNGKDSSFFDWFQKADSPAVEQR